MGDGISKLEEVEVAALTKRNEKRATAHVKRHLSAFVVAAMLSSAKGYETDEEAAQPWS